MPPPAYVDGSELTGDYSKKGPGDGLVNTFELLDYLLQLADNKLDFSAVKLAATASIALTGDDVTGIGVLDDVAIPIVWAGSSAVFLTQNANILALRQQEINRWLAKNVAGFGTTYMLIANEASKVKDVRGNDVFLKPGDIWKSGETIKLSANGRYTKSDLGLMIEGGVTLVPIFYETIPQIKVQEKIMITGYYLEYGELPPGNKVFR